MFVSVSGSDIADSSPILLSIWLRLKLRLSVASVGSRLMVSLASCQGEPSRGRKGDESAIPEPHFK